MRNRLFSLGALLTGFSLFIGFGTTNAQNYTAEEMLEIQADLQAQTMMKISNPFEPIFGTVDYGTEGTMADWTPVAGATETFTPAVGDHFFDPGGPGGGADGSAGNYPNCNCDTQTTLSGVSQIKIHEMDIFANFDYLRIYDGTSTSGTLLYGNGAGDPNDGDYGLPADTVLNAASGNFFFFFHASSVVNRLGWDIEIMGGGGGGSDYCIPAGTNPSYYINDFFTTGADTNITNMGTGFSTGGYGDFYSTHGVSAAIGDSFDFTANFPSGQTYGFRIWVDWNQDGVFDTTEEVAYQSSSYQNSQTGTITVPSTALPGDTRMRIVGHWLNSSGNIDPCATNHSYGEFEDYKFTVAGGTTDYCIPAGTNPSYYINDFFTTGADADITNMGTGFSPGGYGDFYSTHGVSAAKGNSFNFTANFPTGQTYGFRIWVDWNQDGVFDTSEEVAYQSSSYQNVQTGTITVPAAALEGDTRMRIVGHWLNSSGNIDPCATNHSYGEFEDYKFTVTPGGGGSGCLWTVHVFDSYWGDEVEWELRDSGGTALISGGPYGSNYDDTQTVTNAGPVTFWITNDGFIGDNTPSYEVSNENGIILSGQLNSPTTETFADLKCSDGGGGGTDCDALFTSNAAAGTANGFAGVTFDIVNETSEEMTITGFKVPVSGSNSSFDMDIYYTTTASSNVGVHQDPSAWTLLESKTEIPAQNAVPFDPSTFSQVDLNNTLVLQPGQSKGIYLFVTDYGEGNTYRYSNGNYTETDGTITILSNGYGSNATVFSSGFANRAFVGEVQYCTGEGGGGTGSPCSQEYMTGSDPLSSPNGAGITGGNRVANDVIVAANDSFTVQKVTVPVIYLNGSPTTFNVQFYEDDGSGTGGIGADLGPAISYGAGDYTSTFLGNWAGAYPLYMVELPIPDVLLENNSSSDAHFWIVIDGAVSTTGDFGYIVEFNHDGNPSHHTLQYLASSSSWIVYNDPNDMEAYMIVDGICGEEGGGGGACENPVLEINQDVDDTCMANFSQGGLAQSYKPLDSSAAGAGIKLRESSTGLNVTLSLWDGLPNAGGTMLTTGTTQTTGDVWVDVFWDEIVTVTVGDTYYIVIEGDTSLPCIAGSINNPYPDGMVFANAYGAWPNYDYTFRTYSCGEAPSGGPCDEKIVMDCGVTYTADLVPGAGEWVNYTGVTWSYTGSEQVFEFTAPTTGTYTFELSQGTNDADFMVMDACSNTANNLIGGYWTGLTNETITLTGGVTYYIIADLYSGASGGTTVSIKVNCPAAGGSDCEDNKVPTGGLTNGYFFTNQLAVDIITNAAGFNIYGTKVNVFVDSGTDLNFSFNFYNDASGLPGASFDSASGTVLDSDYVGSAFGYDVYTFTVKFDHAISLAGNSTYWMEVISDGVAWESTTADIFGSLLAINNGSGWAIDDEEFVYEIICQELGLNDLTAYDFAYWPNPVTDMLNITSQKAVKTVEAYNLTGQKVMATDKIVNGQIDVNALSPGVYVFKAVLEDGQVETFKIIKK